MYPLSTKAWRPEPHDCAKQGNQTSNITTLQQKRRRDECAAIQAGGPQGWQGRGGSQQIELRSHPTQHLWTYKEARVKYLHIYIHIFRLLPWHKHNEPIVLQYVLIGVDFPTYVFIYTQCIYTHNALCIYICSMRIFRNAMHILFLFCHKRRLVGHR